MPARPQATRHRKSHNVTFLTVTDWWECHLVLMSEIVTETEPMEIVPGLRSMTAWLWESLAHQR
jgi:hypothetical protein